MDDVIAPPIISHGDSAIEGGGIWRERWAGFECACWRYSKAAGDVLFVDGLGFGEVIPSISLCRALKKVLFFDDESFSEVAKLPLTKGGKTSRSTPENVEIAVLRHREIRLILFAADGRHASCAITMVWHSLGNQTFFMP